MLTTATPIPTLAATSPDFVAAHRLVGEVAAGRPVLLRTDGELTLCAPLDGPGTPPGTLAISASRAQYLGLPERPTLLQGTADRARLWQLAAGHDARLEGIASGDGGTLAAAATELAKLAERLPAMILYPPIPAGAAPLEADAGAVLSIRQTLAATIEPVGSAAVPLAAGATANVTAFRDAVGGALSAVMVGTPGTDALVRVHSSCITGDVLGSLKCDCGAQLQMALSRIASEGGVLIYAAQEGRGIGLVNKLRAYRLQDHGLDTVDANLALGYHDDERDYALAAAALRYLGLSRIRLLTNNPHKTAALQSFGLSVTPVPIRSAASPHNAGYLATKQRRSGHQL